MVERRAWPVIMSAPMVRALLSGRKTQTRRLPTSMWINAAWTCNARHLECWLWVREQVAVVGANMPIGTAHLIYTADEMEATIPAPFGPHKISLHPRPSIHMPRWASRLSLRVEAIGLERLQEISEEDAIAEGSQTPLAELPKAARQASWNERQAFSRIWDSLHTDPGDQWIDNPEVYAIRFTPLQRNINEVLRDVAA